jgi:hypothetical protein
MGPRFSRSLLLASLLGCSSPATRPFDERDAELAIRHIEHLWAQVAVTGDPTVIEEIFADDFLGVAPDGAQYTKQAFIADTRAHPLAFLSNDVDSIRIRFLGAVAIAQGSESFRRADSSLGRFVWTDVLEYRQGRWLIVAAQDVMLSLTTSSPKGLFERPSKP